MCSARAEAPRVEAWLQGRLAGFPDARLCLALSGGTDSLFLLSELAALARRQARLALRAIHVDHGLQPGSARWAESCREHCRRLDVPLAIIRLELRPPPGESLEAVAREARYAALCAALEPGEWLLTAQHQDDQLESVLLQLMRGAGLPGLSGMPETVSFGPGQLGRPLLGWRREDIESRARDAGLVGIEDPMNEDRRFDRAFLRHEVLPRLRERWPAAARTVARSARHVASAQRLLEALAAADAGEAAQGHRLALSCLDGLAHERQANLLRWWLGGLGLPVPGEARLNSLLGDVIGAREDAQPEMDWGGLVLRRYRGWLHACRPLARRDEALEGCRLQAGDALDLGAGLGRLVLAPVNGMGIRAEVAAAGLELRWRAGQAALRTAPNRPRQALRKLYQSEGVLPWMRPMIPLVWAGGRLAAVGDLWLDVDLAAGEDEAGVLPQWQDRPALY